MTFQEAKRQVVDRLQNLRGPGRGAVDLIDLVHDADNWDVLEKRLLELRTISRRRQQEILERIEPLGGQIEALLERARAAKLRAVRQSLMRQAEGLMRELDAEDEAGKVHARSAAIATELLRQAGRVRAMADHGIDSAAIDAVAEHVEDRSEVFDESWEAAQELAGLGAISEETPASTSGIRDRLRTVPAGPDITNEAIDDQEQKLRRRLYAEPA